MLTPRVIPVLLISKRSLVKTRKFGKFDYVGDPCNTAKIFNELEVDELIVLDIGASRYSSSINYDLLKDMASECFMPLAYGGGIKSIEDAERLFRLGVEKVSLNSSCIVNPDLIGGLARTFGSQAVIVSIDVMRRTNGSRFVRGSLSVNNGGLDPVAWATEVAERGAGEILLTCVEREGSWSGIDLELVSEVTSAVRIPVIAQGGVGSLDDVRRAIIEAKATSVGVGSFFVYQKEGCGILVHYPSQDELKELFVA